MASRTNGRDTQKDGLMGRWTDGRKDETDRQREIERERERQRDRETERQRDRETERQRDRQTERQRDRQTERQKYRGTESHGNQAYKIQSPGSYISRVRDPTHPKHYIILYP